MSNLFFEFILHSALCLVFISEGIGTGNKRYKQGNQAKAGLNIDLFYL
jgi:hypothetical protein